MLDERGRLSTPETVQIRDLVCFGDGDRVYVTACDASAAIGERPGDHLRQPPEIVGYSVAKVPLMEVLAAGAEPFLVVNSLGGPLDEYGRRIVEGIRRALAEASSTAYVTGSDETNMPTVQTGVGVMVIGSAPADALSLGSSEAGDVVWCAGVPRDGLVRPYVEGAADVASVADVATAVRSGLAHEILPVGSRGLRYELGELAGFAQLSVELYDDGELELDRSAGASTCFLISGPEDAEGEFTSVLRLPLRRIGRLLPRSEPAR